VNVLAYVHLRNIHSSTGAGRFSRNMIEETARLGHHDLAILADAADHRDVVPKVGAPWTDFSYRFITHGTSRQQALWALLDRPTAESYWPEVDIVYCAAESYVPRRRARLAVTAHDAAFFEKDAHPADWAHRKQEMKWRLLYRKLARHADRIFTVSRFSAERLGHFFPALEGRFRVVPSAIPWRFFEPVSADGEAQLARLGLAGRRFAMLPRGLHYRKNADLVLEAWPRLHEMHPDLLLVITSHSEAAYVEKARALGPSVILTDFIDDELLCSIYHAASVLWFPSLYEGFGLPPLEAMACGTPVVASNSSSIPEVSGDAAILVAPGSLDDNIQAIDSLLRSPAACDRLIAAGRERARRYTWAHAARRLDEELADLQ
jgi:glycosyltransferase involved in cell wall biosynthesis